MTITRHQHYNLAQCKSSCLQHTECTGFDFDANQGKDCYLKKHCTDYGDATRTSPTSSLHPSTAPMQPTPRALHQAP